MATKSIRLTEQEDTELRDYLALTGEAEADALKRATLRGLRDLRIERAILTYLDSRDLEQSARIAGLARAELLQALIDKGITVLDGPSTLRLELEELAE